MQLFLSTDDKFWNGNLRRNFVICFSNFQQGKSSWERKEVNMSITVSPEFSFWLSWHHIRQRVCGLLLHLEEIHILFSFDIKTLRNLLPFSIVWISWQINLRLMENRLKRKKRVPFKKSCQPYLGKMKEDIIFPAWRPVTAVILGRILSFITHWLKARLIPVWSWMENALLW